jgi:hypothetical protein
MRRFFAGLVTGKRRRALATETLTQSGRRFERRDCLPNSHNGPSTRQATQPAYVGVCAAGDQRPARIRVAQDSRAHVGPLNPMASSASRIVRHGVSSQDEPVVALIGSGSSSSWPWACPSQIPSGRVAKGGSEIFRSSRTPSCKTRRCGRDLSTTLSRRSTDRI